MLSFLLGELRKINSSPSSNSVRIVYDCSFPVGANGGTRRTCSRQTYRLFHKITVITTTVSNLTSITAITQERAADTTHHTHEKEKDSVRRVGLAFLPSPPSHFLRDNNSHNHDNSNHHNLPSSSSDVVMPPSAHIPAGTKGFRGMGSIDSPGDDAAYFPHFPRSTAPPAGPPSSIYRPQQPPTSSSFRMTKEVSSSFHQPSNIVMQLIDDALLLPVGIPTRGREIGG